MNIAIITGASSGLGKEYVYAINQRYSSLDEIWVVARREDRLNEIKSLLGEKIRVVPADLTNSEDILKISNLLKETSADVKLLVNNAGFGKIGDFKDLPVEENAGMIRLNCEALTVVTATVLPFMKKGGKIINISSIASFAPNTRLAVYSSTKAFVMSLSRAMRVELKPFGINVLAVCPGPMDTEFLPVANILKGTSRTFDTLPHISPKKVAIGSLKASDKSRAVYTNHILYKFYRILGKLLPHSIVMKICGA